MRVIFSDWRKNTAKSSIAKSGQEQTMSEVFVAVVKSMAAFSAKKYTEPPVMPRAIIRSSSCQERQNQRKEDSFSPPEKGEPEGV